MAGQDKPGLEATPQSMEKAEVEKSKSKWLSLIAVGAVLVWWVANALATVASKQFMLHGVKPCCNGTRPAWTEAFSDLRWVDLTAMQHAVGSLISVVVLKSSSGCCQQPGREHGHQCSLRPHQFQHSPGGQSL